MTAALFSPAGARKTLRPHQVRAIEELRAAFRTGARRVVVQMATGAGKTLTAAKILEGALNKGHRAMFTVPALSLVEQTVDAFEAEGVTDIGVMQARHPRTDPGARVQVATVQTLARRELPAEPALVIVDECHIRSTAVDRLMDINPTTFFVGLSATPWSKGMGLRWERLVVAATTADLIEAGHLCPFRAFAPSEPDLEGVRLRAGEFREDDLAKRMNKVELVGDVVETWLARGEDRPTLVFAVNRAHAARLHERFEAAGVAAAYVDMNTDRVERAMIERQFRAGEIKVACSVRTLTTGVDWPVACIVDAAPTKSEMLHCLDSETEILTSAGWKGIGEVSVGDCVASCRGSDQRQGQWALVTDTVRRPMGAGEKWVSYESVHANFRVTGDHRMIFATGQRAMRFGTALDLAGKSDGAKVPSAISIEQPGVPLSADELWLVGMLMADGTVNERSQQISITQSERHPGIVGRIEDTLQKLGVSYRKSPVSSPKDGDMQERHRRWRFNMSVGSPKPKVGVGRFAPHPESVRFDGWRGLRWLMPWVDKDMALGLIAMSREQFEALLSGLWDGDGSKKQGVDYEPKTRQIITVRRVLADRLQALGAVNGYTVNLRHFDPDGRSRQYLLSFKAQDWRHVGGSGRKPAFNVSPPTDEEVWCVTTSTGSIVTRRRGKVTVMGNCQKIGRGLRVNPPWEDCLILDHAGNSRRLGLVTDIRHEALDDGKPPAESAAKKKPVPKPVLCPACAAVVPVGRSACPECGAEVRRSGGGVREVEGDLDEVGGTGPLTPTEQEQRRFWRMAAWIDGERGKGGRLALSLFKQKFGVWPRFDIEAEPPEQPTRAFMNWERSRRIAYARAMAAKKEQWSA